MLKLQDGLQIFPWGKTKWDTFTRTEQIWIEYNDTLSQLCHYSKNLWNEANYRLRQDFKSLNVFTNQQVKIDNGFLIFPESLGIQPVKTRLGDDTQDKNTKIKEARIIPKGTGYVLEIVYQKDSVILDLNLERIF